MLVVLGQIYAIATLNIYCCCIIREKTEGCSPVTRRSRFYLDQKILRCATHSRENREYRFNNPYILLTILCTISIPVTACQPNRANSATLRKI